jgi:hypothetical protein
MASLTEFLRQKASAAHESDPAAARQRYREQVQRLINEVKALLAPSESDGTVSNVVTKSVSLYEGRADSYDAPSMSFSVGPTSLRLEPRGASIVGALGRVDLIGPNGEATFVLLRDSVDQSTFNWYLAGRVKGLRRPVMADPPSSGGSDWQSERASRPILFSEETFLAALRYVLP